MSQRIPVRILPRLDDLLQAEHDENTVREPFRPSEAVAIAEALMPIEQQAARERMEAGVPLGILPKGRAADKVANAVGMSRRSLDAAAEVVRAAHDGAAMSAPTITGHPRASDRVPAGPLGESASSPGLLAEGHHHPDTPALIAIVRSRRRTPQRPRYWRAGRWVIFDDGGALWTLSRDELADLTTLPRAWPDGRYGWSAADLVAAVERAHPHWARIVEALP